MCDPFAMASAALSATSAGAGYMGQMANYSQQKRAFNQNVANANTALGVTYANDQLHLEQQRQAAVQQKTEEAIQGLQARGSAAAAAGEAGVHGLSVDRLIGDYYAKQGRYDDAVDQNFQVDQLSTAGQMDAARAGAQNQINSMPRPQAPSLFSTGLQIVGGGLQAGRDYLASQNKRG